MACNPRVLPTPSQHIHVPLFHKPAHLPLLISPPPFLQAEMIGRIEHTDEQKQKKIQQWVTSIMDIHKNKPAATVTYAHRMPEIEELMQASRGGHQALGPPCAACPRIPEP